MPVRTASRWAAVASVALVFLLSIGAASPASALTTASTEVATKIVVPDMVGEPANLAEKAIKALKLKVKIDGQGKMVLSKKNWVVLSQKPAAGTEVKAKTKVTLTVVKKSSIVDDARGVVACKQYADDVDAFNYATDWPLYDFTSQKLDLGVIVEQHGTAQNAFGAEEEVSIRCTVEGTKKDFEVTSFEVLAQ